MLKTVRCFSVALAIVFFAGVPAEAADMVDLQKTPWGMNRKETAKAVGIKVPLNVTKDSGLTVTGFELGGFDGTMGYIFQEDRLIEIHFRVGGLTGGKFTAGESTALRERLSKQFDRNYGQRVVNDATCDNVPDCRFSLWNKDASTAVGLFSINSQTERSLGVGYMERLKENPDGAFWQPHQGLTILPPDQSQKSGVAAKSGGKAQKATPQQPAKNKNAKKSTKQSTPAKQGTAKKQAKP